MTKTRDKNASATASMTVAKTAATATISTAEAAITRKSTTAAATIHLRYCHF